MSPEGPIVRASYVLRQRFRYDYPGPIHDLRHRLVVAPPLLHGDQRRLSQGLTVAPPLEVRWHKDGFGNLVATIEAPAIVDAVEFEYEAVIERSDGELPRIDAEWLDDARYRVASALTLPSEAMRAVAVELRRAGDHPYGLAVRVNDFVATHMRYVSGVTSVATTAAEAFAQGEGVCQDYAHVMLAIARACGLAARYVSGHLIGEGGTHAWVEVLGWAADRSHAVAWGFDPTHRRVTNLDYVFVAAGRDYADVPPTSGSFSAPYVGRFTADRRLDVVDAEHAA
jgi:transglutaminase-like putative cysteine protease